MTDPFPPDPDPDLDAAAPEAPDAPDAPARTRFAAPAVPPADPVGPVAADPVGPVATFEPAHAEAPSEAPPAAPPAPPVAPAAPLASLEEDLPVAAPERTQGRGLVAALTTVVVVLAVLTAFLGWRAVDTAGKAPVEDSRTQAVSAARAAALLVFSYDYRHLDKDFKAGRAVTTGQFQGEYDKTTARLVADVAPRYQAVVSADVSAAAVVEASESSVLTLVFVNQQSTSTLMKTPKITTSRLEMTMVRKGNRWLVSKIRAL